MVGLRRLSNLGIPYNLVQAMAILNICVRYHAKMHNPIARENRGLLNLFAGLADTSQRDTSSQMMFIPRYDLSPSTVVVHIQVRKRWEIH
jgi:hypothetical protein